jgi:hypothetical protein
MSISYPLDDVRNQRWDELLEYIDELASTTSQNAMSMLLCSVSAYSDVCHVIKKIVALGGDPSFEDNEVISEEERIRFFDGEGTAGSSPLGCSIFSSAWCGIDTLDTMRCLISCGANANGLASSNTALQLAIMFKLYEHARLLLANGADPYRESAELDHQNAFEIASDDEYAIELLREALKN